MDAQDAVAGIAQRFRVPVIEHKVGDLTDFEDIRALSAEGLPGPGTGAGGVGEFPAAGEKARLRDKGGIGRPSGAAGGDAKILIFPGHKCRCFPLLIDQGGIDFARKAQIVVRQARKVECLVPVAAVDKPGSAFCVLEERHVAAVKPIGLQGVQEGEGAGGCIRYSAASSGARVVGGICVKPHDVFAGGRAMKYLGALQHLAGVQRTGGVVGVCLQGKPFIVPGEQIPAGVTGHTDDVHAGSAGTVVRPLVFTIPVP